VSKRILVVDDIHSNVMLMEAWLQAEGFDTSTAFSGAECLERLASEATDLVLLDVMMPVMDGTEVCRRIKANPAIAGIPVVLLTALNIEAARDAAAKAGANDFLVKPVSDDALLACLRKHLREP
jgi:two-component system cell cycle response regulator